MFERKYYCYRCGKELKDVEYYNGEWWGYCLDCDDWTEIY